MSRQDIMDYKDTKEFKDYCIRTYGVEHPREFAPDDEPKLQEGQCVCGAFDCKESYSCYTSGY